MSATMTQLLSSGEFCKLRYDTLSVKSASANISFYTNNSKMPNFELWHLLQMSDMFSLLLSMRISALFFTALLNGLKSLNWDDKHISESQRTNCVYLRFLVNDQLDTQFFSKYVFQSSRCFEQPRAHHQENQLYQYNSWCRCRSERNFPTCTQNGHRHRVTYARCCIDTIDSCDDEHEVAQNM